MDKLSREIAAFERQAAQARKRFHMASLAAREEIEAPKARARADRRERIARRSAINALRYAFDVEG